MVCICARSKCHLRHSVKSQVAVIHIVWAAQAVFGLEPPRGLDFKPQKDQFGGGLSRRTAVRVQDGARASFGDELTPLHKRTLLDLRQAQGHCGQPVGFGGGHARSAWCRCSSCGEGGEVRQKDRTQIPRLSCSGSHLFPRQINGGRGAFFTGLPRQFEVERHGGQDAVPHPIPCVVAFPLVGWVGRCVACHREAMQVARGDERQFGHIHVG